MSNENGFFSPNLETAAIGRPITRAGISFFPVYLTGNDVPAIATGPGAKRVIDELDDASVPDLAVTNPGKSPLLLVEGEQFIGGEAESHHQRQRAGRPRGNDEDPRVLPGGGSLGPAARLPAGGDEHAPPGSACAP